MPCLVALLILMKLYNYLIALHYFELLLLLKVVTLYNLKSYSIENCYCCLTTLSRQRLLASPSSSIGTGLIQALDWHRGRHYAICSAAAELLEVMFLKASLCEMLRLGAIPL